MAIAATHPLVYIIIGGPGSDKGALAESLQKSQTDLVYISTGSLAKKEIESDQPLNRSCKEAIKSHKPLPDGSLTAFTKKTEEFIKMTLLKNNGIILNGYPKTIQQCEFLAELIKANGLQDRVIVISLKVDDKETIETPDQCDACNKAPRPTIDHKERMWHFQREIKSILKYYGDRVLELSNATPKENWVEEIKTFYENQSKEASS